MRARKGVSVCASSAGMMAESVSDRIVALWCRCRSWVGKGLAAILDQGLVSGSNFLLTVLLARWLQPEQYGAYALAFAIFLLLSLLQHALLLEPMSVLGPSLYRGRRRDYLGSLLWIYAVLAAAIMALLGIASLVAYYLALPGGMAGALAGLTLAAPCVLLLWLVRRAFYLELAPGQAASSSVFYCALLLGGLVIVYRSGWLSPFTAYLLMALAALLVTVLRLLRLKPVVSRRANPLSIREVWQQHWAYGRWSLATAVLSWLPHHSLPLLTIIFVSMAEVGGLRAVMNILLPVNHTVVAISLLFLPYVSGLFGERGAAATRTPVQRVSILYLSGGVAYWALATLFKEPIFHALYGGKYMEFVYLVPWACAASVFGTVMHASFIGLRAMQSPASVFVANSAGAAVTLVLGIAGAWMYGLPGAIGAYALANLARLVVGTFLFNKKVRSVGGTARAPEEVLSPSLAE